MNSNPGRHRREETVVARYESFLLEIEYSNFVKFKDDLTQLDLRMDYFTLMNYLKLENLKKKSWKQFF